ncbi:MAG TPA: sigma-70 family RNA polymerase sigma factor [Acidobacteriaceae bacterium]|jgi:RNA polymerase sigma-70 factor (ECF subfamily)
MEAVYDIGSLETHRSAIIGHCYRMLGSFYDAEDATQEAMVRAWKGLDRFDGRASLKNWLYRIATNVCLDEIHNKGRRARPIEEGSPFSGTPSLDDLGPRAADEWIEPISDVRALASDADPAERVILKQSIRLAFVAALQKLAPKQRAALLLTDVLGFSAAEAAETLETSVASVNSALQRGRAALSDKNFTSPTDLTKTQQKMLDRYVAAFEQYDIDSLTTLLREDATISMPPYSLWFQGVEAIRAWMLGLGCGCRGSRLQSIEACGSPAFAQYRPDPEGGHKAWAIIVLELTEDRIASVNSFLDVENLFPRFGLPLRLPAA